MWTKDVDQIHFWGFFFFAREHLLCKWSKGQSLGMQRRVGRAGAGTLGDTGKGIFIATPPSCSLEEKRLNGRAGRSCGRPGCAANENFMRIL